MTQQTRNALPPRLRDVVGSSVELAYVAPGRANLMGEHTDYNDGFVLPVALDMATFVAGRRLRDEVRLLSLDEDGPVDVDLETGEGPREGWGRYVTAVVKVLVDAGVSLEGLDGVLASDVPVGSGLSSSAALEVAVASALAAEPLAPERLATLCRRAENQYVGVNAGIMDQLTSAAGRRGHALLVDCRDVSFRPVPIPDHVSMLVVDSGIRRGLDDSGYNDRRSQCDDAAAALGVASLRQVSLEMLQSGASSMDRVLVKRARHVITENDRVMRTAEALENGRLDDVARLFESSHGSYADDFEASLPDIDCLVEIARNTEGVFGARLTGGGFGGCTVSLVATETAAAAGAEIVERYRAKTGRSGRWWVSGAADGAHEVVLR